jgi:hypothetical protein
VSLGVICLILIVLTPAQQSGEERQSVHRFVYGLKATFWMEPGLFHRNGDNGLTPFKRIDAATSWPLETDVDRIEAPIFTADITTFPAK